MDSIRPASLLRRVVAESGGRPKIAVVRAGRIGDLICATPALRALRCAAPQAQISLIALPFLQDLAGRVTSIDRYIPFPGYPGIAEQLFDSRSCLQFFAWAQAERFDLALQMHGTGVYANQFTLMLGARATAGFVRPGDDRGLLDVAIPFPVFGPEPERLLDLMREIGVETETCRVEFTLRDEERRDARRLLGDSCRPLIGLHIGGIGRGKRVDRGLVLEALAQVQAVRGGTVVVLGSPEDRLETAAPWALDCASIIELTGRTSLPVLGGVVAALDVFVGNDSGPAHVAYALGTPSVTLFRNTEPERWGPPQSGPHAVLVEPHSSEAISRKVDELLAATGPALD